MISVLCGHLDLHTFPDFRQDQAFQDIHSDQVDLNLLNLPDLLQYLYMREMCVGKSIVLLFFSQQHSTTFTNVASGLTWVAILTT